MEIHNIDLKTTGLALASVLFIEWGAHVISHCVALNPMLILGAARCLEIAALTGMIHLFGDQAIRSIGLCREHMLAGLKIGMLWSLGFGFLVGSVYGILVTAGVNPLLLMKAHLPSKRNEILLFFIVGAVVSPVAEEIFFRGILYGFFRKWGFWLAISASTILFALAHQASSNGIPVTQIIGGVLFAVAYEKEKNLVVPMVIHILGNLAIFTVSLISLHA